MSHDALLRQNGGNSCVSRRLSYLDRLQETGISVLHSIFPFSHFWWPEMVPDGFSVMILYLRGTNGCITLMLSCLPRRLQLHLAPSHDFFVPARPFERPERKAASGGVVKRDADAPQIHRGTVLLLVVFPQDGSLVHVGMLHRKHTKKSPAGEAHTVTSHLTCGSACERHPVVFSSPGIPRCRTETRTARRPPALWLRRSPSACTRSIRLLQSRA